MEMRPPTPAASDNTEQLLRLGNTQAGFNGLFQTAESFHDVGTHMDPDHAATVARQTLQITQSLCSFEDTKGIGFIGNGKIFGIITGHLNKDAGVGTALMKFTRGMKEAWSVA